MKSPEQLSQGREHTGTSRDGKRRGRRGNFRWYLKRLAARSFRHAAKRDLDPPTRRAYWGWE